MFGRNINVGMTDSGGGTVRPPADTDKPKKTEQTLFKKTQKKLEEPATVEEPQSVAPTSPTTPTQTTEQPTLESLFSEMLARYMPETVSYTPLDQDAIREMLIEWLRPAYEQAIQSRREQTKRSNAELDADAWARGMGTSTYVTDVKDRAFQNEARDVDALEGNYAATLAGQLYDAMQKQQEQALQVEQFNAEQWNRARERAMTAATALYQTYMSNSSGGTRSTATKRTAAEQPKETGSSKQTTDTTESTPTIGIREITNLIASMTPETRKALYAGTGDYAKMYREIVDSIGMNAFRRLMKAYPTTK